MIPPTGPTTPITPPPTVRTPTRLNARVVTLAIIGLIIFSAFIAWAAITHRPAPTPTTGSRAAVTPTPTAITLSAGTNEQDIERDLQSVERELGDLEQTITPLLDDIGQLPAE